MIGKQESNYIVSHHRNFAPIHLNELTNAGFGAGLGKWKENDLTNLVRGLSKLKFNINMAVYTGGILGYLNNVVKKPISEIEARLKMFLFKDSINLLINLNITSLEKITKIF